jgi:hypothetical protein
MISGDVPSTQQRILFIASSVSSIGSSTFVFLATVGSSFSCSDFRRHMVDDVLFEPGNPVFGDLDPFRKLAGALQPADLLPLQRDAVLGKLRECDKLLPHGLMISPSVSP